MCYHWMWLWTKSRSKVLSAEPYSHYPTMHACYARSVVRVDKSTWNSCLTVLHVILSISIVCRYWCAINTESYTSTRGSTYSHCWRPWTWQKSGLYHKCDWLIRKLMNWPALQCFSEKKIDSCRPVQPFQLFISICHVLLSGYGSWSDYCWICMAPSHDGDAWYVPYSS